MTARFFPILSACMLGWLLNCWFSSFGNKRLGKIAAGHSEGVTKQQRVGEILPKQKDVLRSAMFKES